MTYDDIVVTISTLKPQEQIDLLEVLSSSLRKNFKQREKEHSLLELEGLGADRLMFGKISILKDMSVASVIHGIEKNGAGQISLS